MGINFKLYNGKYYMDVCTKRKVNVLKQRRCRSEYVCKNKKFQTTTNFQYIYKWCFQSVILTNE